jgi:hypothetical protein
MPTRTSPRRPTRHRRVRRTPAGLAAERAPAYEVGDAGGAGGEGGSTSTPFGLPVLAELPELAATLEELVAADAAMSRAVARLASMLATPEDEVASVSGVPVEDWIAIVARHTRMDRRLLLRTARLLLRFPALHRAVETRQVSWPQVRGLSLTLRSAPPELDRRLDGYLEEALTHLADADPDAVVRQVERTIIEWTAELQPDAPAPEPGNRLRIQPRLDGTGGRVDGEYDAVGLAILDDATAPRRDQLDHPGGVSGARADNLLAWLAHSCPPSPGRPPDAPSSPPAAADALGPEVTADPAPEHPPSEAAPGEPAAEAGAPTAPAAVKLLLRWDLESLLDRRRAPADLLVRLTGGRLRLSSPAARRLLEERGAEVRSVIVDDGEVIGVGRTTRVPPGWLRDAVLSVHDTCTAPQCDRPARGADLDHAVPWTPPRAGDPFGTTDVANLGPMCATTNRAKEAAGWRASQLPDGRRVWTHRRSGLRTTSVPATWRPPPARRSRGDPPGSGPPG